jgi:hypothetical protein
MFKQSTTGLALAVCLGACQSAAPAPGEQVPPFAGVGGSAGEGSGTSEEPGVEVPVPAPETSDGAPGRTALRRLNQTEYDNTVRDLLGTSLKPSVGFPPDQSADGFDTVGSALTTSLSHLEAYEGAAQELIAELFARSDDDPARRRVLSCDVAVDGCVREVLSGFADRAFRRPVLGAEVDRLVQLADNVAELSGGDVEAGLRTALVAVLISPQFIYRIERPENPTSGALQPLKDHELATRLSYLLWSSMPDDTLRAAADAGELTGNPMRVRDAVARMLADPKADAFFENFVGQWLLTRSLDTVDFSREAYPDFDPGIRESAAAETYRFARHLLEQDRPISEFFTADYTFVDQRLAQHYGLDVEAPADGFVQASLAGTERAGILGQTSFLMRVSAPDRTSPVKRGAMVLDALLCAPLPPPPPDVVAALDTPPPESGTTLRDILEQHRADPRCGGCHNLMDPIGLGLENFDAIGSYRTEENGAPIDASGTFLDGTSFSGAIELAGILARDERFARCLTRKLLTYAVGRPFALDDRAANAYVAGLDAQMSVEGTPSFGDWLNGVVSSDAFTMQRGSEE